MISFSVYCTKLHWIPWNAMVAYCIDYMRQGWDWSRSSQSPKRMQKSNNMGFFLPAGSKSHSTNVVTSFSSNGLATMVHLSVDLISIICHGLSLGLGLDWSGLVLVLLFLVLFLPSLIFILVLVLNFVVSLISVRKWRVRIDPLYGKYANDSTTSYYHGRLILNQL